MTLHSAETRKKQPLKALPIPALSKMGDMEGGLHSSTGHDKGSNLSHKEHDLNPASTSTACTTLHSIRAAPPSGSTVKRASSLKSPFQEALTYHYKYEARKTSNL